MMHPTSAEATVVRNYIDWIVSLPWDDKSEETHDLKAAEAILDEDHYGLRRIKERILEYLAVQALTKKLKGPVLCFVGPPGVGKTSLGKSIARATGRKFVRLSLGGVRDEAEIRGHRRTYIGAMPGKLIQSLKKAGTNNPLFLLDEIDKMSTDFRGDPAAALLEVLDGEQNATFNDHYLDLDYDLSDVMFITTANTLSGIPVPLQDRMEIIQLSGYTEFEKLNIAVKYLVPRQMKECGLETVPFTITENAIRTVIHHYTREAGVRSLEREISSICRKVARQVVDEGAEPGKAAPIEVVAKVIPKYLGVPKFSIGKNEDKDEVGLTNGLSVTSNGGGELLACEVAVVAGKGKLVITGLLEKGMEESAQAAMSYVRSRAKLLGLEADFYQKVDVHVHFPEFIRKDGPSAGVTMATSLASALIKVPVRRDLAMTGELTLRGRVMPIGGLEGEAPRGSPERHHDGHRPEGEPEGSARGPAARPQGDAHRARRSHGRGAPRGALPPRSERALRPAARRRWSTATASSSCGGGARARCRTRAARTLPTRRRPRAPVHASSNASSELKLLTVRLRLRRVRAPDWAGSSVAERWLYTPDVAGSIPVPPTKLTSNGQAHRQVRRKRQKPLGAVVKLVITPACHAGGRGFESRPPRYTSPDDPPRPSRVDSAV